MDIKKDVTLVLGGIEVAAEKVLNFVAKAQKASPSAIAALAVILGAVAKVATDVQGVATAPLNITLDQSALADIKAVWPDLVAFGATLGIKL